VPSPIIANTFLVSFLWTGHGGVTPRNVLGFTSTGDKVHVGTVVSGAILSNQFSMMTSDFTMPRVSVLPLDGSSASYISTPDIGAAGTQSGAINPGQACVVSLKTALRGPAHRGRVYLGPVATSISTSGVIQSAEVTAAQTAWNSFLAACAAASPPVVWVVVSRKHLTTNVVGQCIVEAVAGTQRRRQTQLRP
jgi:hypothetical protein